MREEAIFHVALTYFTCSEAPSMHLILKEGDGSFLVVDLLMICIGILLFAFPVWIRKNGVVGAHGS